MASSMRPICIIFFTKKPISNPNKNAIIIETIPLVVNIGNILSIFYNQTYNSVWSSMRYESCKVQFEG